MAVDGSACYRITDSGDNLDPSFSTDIVADSRRQTSEMIAIPLDYLKGFFCEITPGMVKRLLLRAPEI